MQTFIGILLGGSFLAFLQFLITRNDAKHDKFAAIVKSIEELRKEIEMINAKGDRREAIQARARILRFGDELIYEPEKRHSKDSYDSVLYDITNYEQYCSLNPSFQNNTTHATAEFIKRNYDDRLEKHDFL